MSDYTKRITIACPETMIPQANQLALATGESPDDDQTFGEPQYVDSFGNRYAVASMLASEDFPSVLQGSVETAMGKRPWLLDRAGRPFEESPGQGNQPPGQGNQPPGQGNQPPGQGNQPPGQGRRPAVGLSLAKAAQQALRFHTRTVPPNSVTPQVLTAVDDPDPEAALNSMGLAKL